MQTLARKITINNNKIAAIHAIEIGSNDDSNNRKCHRQVKQN